MFGFLMTQAARARRDAKNWLEVADKVYHYRRDQLPDNELHELNQRREELRAKIRAEVDAAELKLAIEALEKTLHRTGGRVYPKGSLADNIEFFLAASIVILGIRAYFVQPFKIPTNSMWPTYFGMKHEVFLDAKAAPGPVERVFRFATLGATRRQIVAPLAGELRIPYGVRRIHDREGRVQEILGIPYSTVKGRKWFVLPAEEKEYHLLVGSEDVTVRVPADFDFESMIAESFQNNPEGQDPRTALREAGRDRFLGAQGRFEFTIPSVVSGQPDNWRCVALSTGHKIDRGEVAFSFDILTGDQLFVDRFTYNFFEPEVGQGFVFRTGNIAGIGSDQYYIKRLVGVPGDTIEIKDHVLYRNGKPIDGADAFTLNGDRAGLYKGYQSIGNLAPGMSVNVGESSFFALGDNSFNSQDGRYWGYVPAKDAVGRPLFIYYPFTKRWGPAR